MSYHKKIEEQIEARFSPVSRTTVLDFQQINQAMDRARVMRAQQAGVIARAVVKAARGLFAGLLERARQRQAMAHLNGMDDHLLRDIGLTRGEINAAVLRGKADDARIRQESQLVSVDVALVERSLKHAA